MQMPSLYILLEVNESSPRMFFSVHNHAYEFLISIMRCRVSSGVTDSIRFPYVTGVVISIGTLSDIRGNNLQLLGFDLSERIIKYFLIRVNKQPCELNDK